MAVKYVVNGKAVDRAELMRGVKPLRGVPSMPSPSSWPLIPQIAGCRAKQLEDFKQADRENGVKCDYEVKKGIARPVWKSQAHKRDWLRVRGMVDTDGGYTS